MNRIWNFLKSIELTFWLLLIITIMFITGSLYSRADYHLLESLNNVPLHDWFLKTGVEHPEKTWWIPVLALAMALLALNTLACASDRLVGLWPRRRDMPHARFLSILTPSLVHMLFIIILFGHVLTFIIIKHERYPVETGSTVTLPGNTSLTVSSIDLINYPAGTFLADRLMNGSISLSDPDRPGTKFWVGFLEPARLNGAYLHIEAAKRTAAAKGTTVCNRGEVQSTVNQNPQIFLLYTEDPGLAVIVIFLFVMIALLGWYYGSSLIRKET